MLCEARFVGLGLRFNDVRADLVLVLFVFDSALFSGFGGLVYEGMGVFGHPGLSFAVWVWITGWCCLKVYSIGFIC